MPAAIPATFGTYEFIMFEAARLLPNTFAEKASFGAKCPKAFRYFLLDVCRNWLLAMEKRLGREKRQPNRGVLHEKLMKISFAAMRI